jgi:hypothetical protein
MIKRKISKDAGWQQFHDFGPFTASVARVTEL